MLCASVGRRSGLLRAASTSRAPDGAADSASPRVGAGLRLTGVPVSRREALTSAYMSRQACASLVSKLPGPPAAGNPASLVRGPALRDGAIAPSRPARRIAPLGASLAPPLPHGRRAGPLNRRRFAILAGKIATWIPPPSSSVPGSWLISSPSRPAVRPARSHGHACTYALR